MAIQGLPGFEWRYSGAGAFAGRHAFNPATGERISTREAQTRAHGGVPYERRAPPPAQRRPYTPRAKARDFKLSGTREIAQRVSKRDQARLLSDDGRRVQAAIQRRIAQINRRRDAGTTGAQTVYVRVHYTDRTGAKRVAQTQGVLPGDTALLARFLDELLLRLARSALRLAEDFEPDPDDVSAMVDYLEIVGNLDLPGATS